MLKRGVFSLIFSSIIFLLFLSLVSAINDLNLTDSGIDYELFINTTSGERVVKAYSSPINFYNGTGYESINSTIINQGCDYDYCVRKGIYYADFRGSSMADDFVKFYVNGSYLVFKPINLSYVYEDQSEIVASLVNVSGYTNQSQFVYPSIFGSGFDITYEYLSPYLKEILSIENNSLLQDTNLNQTDETFLSLSFEIESSSLSEGDTWEDGEIYLTGYIAESNQTLNYTQWNISEPVRIQGSISFNNTDGKFMYNVPQPFAWDSNGSFIGLEYELKSVDNAIILSILTPYNWLKNNSRVYPIRIDPDVGPLNRDEVGMAWKRADGTYDFTNYPGTRIDVGKNEAGTIIKLYMLYDLSNNIRNELGEAEVTNNVVEFQVQYDDGLFPALYVRGDADYGASRNAQGWFNYIDGGPFQFNYNIGTNYFFGLDSEIEKLADHSRYYYMHYTGYQSSFWGIVRLWDDAYLSFSYQCVQTEGCNEYCDINLGNGQSCDCNQECSSGNCVGGQCVANLCGNGVIEQGEQCDDGGTSNGDGCSSTCQIEQYWQCNGQPSECDGICGDGRIRGQETCDDGNLNNGDGCSNMCREESEWSCVGEPSYCTCDVPDGSGSRCDCDTDNDCPNGYMCEQSSGYDACVLPTQCGGLIAVIGEDSEGGGIQGLKVFLEGTPKGETDNFGSKEIVVPEGSVACSELQEVQVKCSDEVTVCGTDYVSMDSQNDYDSAQFICDMCLPDPEDLYVERNDIRFRDDISGNTNVSATIHTIGVTASNVDVDIIKVCGGQYQATRKVIPSVSNSQSYIVSSIEDLDGCSKVRINVDPENEIDEGDKENNNQAEEFVIDPVNVYLNVDTSYSLVDNTIEEYINDFANPVSQGDAQLEIFVGGTLGPSVQNGWGKRNELVVYRDEVEGVPYNGIVGKRFDGQGGNPRLYVFGNEIDGTLVALRTLTRERNVLLNERNLNSPVEPFYSSEEDLDAISVFDYMHTDENQASYRDNDQIFADTVDNVLRRNTFNLAIKRVKTTNDDTVLRLKNINQEMSPAFRNFTNTRPVVLGHGIFNNLFSLEEIGVKIARDEAFSESYIRDAWLIEYAGGPNTDCDVCPNYTFDDLTDNYWPALIGGVIKYADEVSEETIDSVDYVGYSLGGGIGIRSYEKYYSSGKNDAGYYVDENGNWSLFNLPSNFVNHMALIAPMGSFNSFIPSPVELCILEYGNEVNSLIDHKNHIDKEDVTIALLIASINDGPLNIPGTSYNFLCTTAAIALGKPSQKVSYNTWRNLTEDIIQNQNDPEPDLSSINEFMIIRGRSPLVYIPIGSDGVIPHGDVDEIYDNLEVTETNEKYKVKVPHPHDDIPNREPSIYHPLISKFLNDIGYSQDDFDNYILEYYIEV
ncbi:hypothetical protein CO038_00645 [Candidatus Pacearchaeota archaeon CG_4_9_14_0_2_um_filter_39_13]|nr:MAG: hypothetical protein CO038_00645 [Candidatus Pacearchaeota archaeon CG_4_9_14_0_2_um_filter_39_13]